jgi:hypothetical protein
MCSSRGGSGVAGGGGSGGNPDDIVSGAVFTLTPSELADTDAYEVADYARILVRLASGVDAFVYAAPEA